MSVVLDVEDFVLDNIEDDVPDIEDYVVDVEDEGKVNVLEVKNDVL